MSRIGYPVWALQVVFECAIFLKQKFIFFENLSIFLSKKSYNMWSNLHSMLLSAFCQAKALPHTVYFFYLSHDFYHSEEFILYTRLSILFVNAYYFFVRSGCVFQSIKNILSWNVTKHTNFQRAKVIEVMVILYVSGINFTPGGHFQF